MTVVTRRRRRFSLKRFRTVPILLSWLIAALVKLLRCTYRVTVEDPHNFLEPGRPWPVIVSLWHNRILFTASCFPKDLLSRATVLISASRDGEYAARIVSHFSLNVLRGSSSRGGFRALRGLMECLADDGSIVLAVDGPRGPRYEPQPGVVALASRCSVPVLPISLNAPSRWNMKSWDGTQIPKPFARVTLVIGAPVWLETNDAEALDTVRQALAAITDDRMKS